MSPLSYNISMSIAECFRSYADRPAVRFDASSQLTYAELERLSNRAAHFLLSQGVRKGDRLALCLEKSASAYILLLAALKIGAPYLFLDPRNPAARMAAILNQCQPKILFHHRSYDGPLQSLSVDCPGGAEIPELIAGDGDPGLPSEAADVTGDDPAYIMFTSGSTGSPKGAVISHDNLIHFIGWIRTLGFTPDDVHSHLNPLYFDNSVFDTYSTLFTGGLLIPFDHAVLQNPSALVARVKEMQVNVWFSVPSLLIFLQVMKVATRENLGGLTKVIFGGEGYPKAKLLELFEQIGDSAEMLNVYGPTECTCICSHYQVAATDFETSEGYLPLGRINPNFSFRILDGDKEVAPGEIGELCLGGRCVGYGYFGQPELAAKAFVQNPLNDLYREVIYRTGDLVRYDPNDGNLYFVGRSDTQVKHMGYRIELEEIQHALSAMDGVAEAAVLQKKSANLSELVAVVASDQPLTEAGLRQGLQAKLPKYMVPSRIHLLPSLPKNPNGKTDRRLLAKEYAT